WGGVGSRDGGEAGGVKRLWRQQVVSEGGGVGMFRWWCRWRRGVGGGGGSGVREIVAAGVGVACRWIL
nr:hypothetical protein [Tanacetum cinerariifolium]